MSPLFRLSVVLAAVCFAAAAEAQDALPSTPQDPKSAPQESQPFPNEPRDAQRLQVGVGVICDSREQVERYLTLKKNGGTSIEDAIKVVNAEARNDRACGVATVAFVPGNEVGSVDMPDGRMRVTQITIVGVATDGGWHRVPGVIQYTAFLERFQEI